MTALAYIEPATGYIARYERGGYGVRKTHDAIAKERVTFTASVVEAFRANPHDDFAYYDAAHPFVPLPAA